MAESIGRVEELLAELAAMNTAVGFETSCLSCAATLKGAAEQTTRAEKAEAELARVKPVLEAVQVAIERHFAHGDRVSDCDLGNCNCLRSIRIAVDAWKAVDP